MCINILNNCRRSNIDIVLLNNTFKKCIIRFPLYLIHLRKCMKYKKHFFIYKRFWKEKEIIKKIEKIFQTNRFLCVIVKAYTQSNFSFIPYLSLSDSINFCINEIGFTTKDLIELKNSITRKTIFLCVPFVI